MHSKINDRSRTIIRINLSGILMNLFLSIAKLIVGFMIRSRAVQLDALNGFSDMFSSLVSMLSTLFASKRADWEHPFGYGRLEYITSMFSTVFIGNSQTYVVDGIMITPRGYPVRGKE